MNRLKSSFALLLTISSLGFFSYLSITILETKNISSTIDSYKYLHLQANIHLEYIKKYILTHTKDEINNFKLKDNRFDVQIGIKEDNNISKYDIFIKTKDKSPISIYARLLN